jgi:hypothetical protein
MPSFVVMGRHRSCALGFPCVISLFGCGGSTLDIGSNDGGTPLSDGAAADSDAALAADALPADAAGDDNGWPDSGYGSYSAAQVAAAQAACAAPHGYADSVSGEADFRSRIAAAWYLCPPVDSSQFPPYSMVFTSDGRCAYLVPDSSGNLVGAHGLNNEGTYEDFMQGNWYARIYLGTGYELVTVGFEASPRRMEFAGSFGIGKWFVPL